ncbi:hypothetical protein NLJ89_g2055 [Agrocybe chaxingu]|uniref:Uncharacterized protein n=1 Tax=Agrocybe chaxingu TaxID=84603 RepID=A0A9W8MYY6_9AGAR|nr:hypothetical protein NLJ89_g2055 [Agrocybe chaxingu]
MSLLELEYAATAPRRWISLPECSNPKEFLPPYTTPRQVLIDLGNQEPGIITSLYLIPGGRYLVTFAWNWIGVWDLGMTLSTCVEDFQPLAIVPVRYDSMFLVHPTPDGRGFRIYLSSNVDAGGSDSNDSDGSDDDHEQLSEFVIYEIYPADDHAKLERIAELQKQPRHSLLHSLSDNRLVILHDSYVKIWDFKLNTWAAWTVEANLDCLQIIVTPKAVILIHTRGINIWATPLLSSRKPVFSEIHIAPVAPLFSISFPDIDLLGFGSYCEGPCDWYSGLPQPLLFDIADTSFPDTIARYKILLDDDLTKAELVRLSTTYFPLGDGVFEPYRFCEGTLVAWWSNNGDRVRGIRTSSSTPGEATDPTFVSKAELPVLKLRPLVAWLSDVEIASLSVPP